MKTGKDLLAVIKAHKNSPMADLIRAAGYVTTNAEGKERLMRAAFYRAAAAAKGLFVRSKPCLVGRQLTYEGTVIVTGAVQIGQRYADQIGLKPGDPFKIEVKRGAIAVIPLRFAAKS